MTVLGMGALVVGGLSLLAAAVSAPRGTARAPFRKALTGIALLVAPMALAAPALAKLASEPMSAPSDTVSWWFGPVLVPNAYIGSELQGGASMGLLHAVYYPIGPGVFNPVPHDTSSRVVGTAGYDLTERRFTIMIFSPPDSCGMRVSAGDEVVYDDSAKTESDVAVVLVVRPHFSYSGYSEVIADRRSGRTPRAHATFTIRAGSVPETVITKSWEKRRATTRTMLPESLKVSWHARPGDRLRFRVDIDIYQRSHGNVPFFDLGIEAEVLFQNLPQGTLVYSTRIPPDRSTPSVGCDLRPTQ